jgi:hypothetical protein
MDLCFSNAVQSHETDYARHSNDGGKIWVGSTVPGG